MLQVFFIQTYQLYYERLLPFPLLPSAVLNRNHPVSKIKNDIFTMWGCCWSWMSNLGSQHLYPHFSLYCLQHFRFSRDSIWEISILTSLKQGDFLLLHSKFTIHRCQTRGNLCDKGLSVLTTVIPIVWITTEHRQQLSFKGWVKIWCRSRALLSLALFSDHPSGTSDLFATCSKDDIRVWHTPENRELLRIVIPNMTCYAIEFMRDGKSIISGNWHSQPMGESNL